MPLRHVDPNRQTTPVMRALNKFARLPTGQPQCALGDESFRATEATDPAERQRLFGFAERYYGGFSGYGANTALVGRTIPVFRLMPIGHSPRGERMLSS